MNRYERLQYFERLVSLRAAHAAQSAEDRVATMTIADAIEWAVELLEAAIVADSQAGATDPLPGSSLLPEEAN